MKFHTLSAIVLFLFLAATFVRPEQCYDRELGWKGDNVKALDDCGILAGEVYFHLGSVVAKTQCVTSVLINFEDSDKAKTIAGPYTHPGEEITLERVPYKCLKYDVRIKVYCGNCIGRRL